MATQTIQFRSPPSQTVTLRLFVAGSDTQIASAAATEATNRKGTYEAAFTDVPEAEYQYIATIGTSPIIPVASGYVLLTLTTSTFQTYDAAKAVNLDEVPTVDAGTIQTAAEAALVAYDAATAADVAAISSATSGDWSITRTFQVSGGDKVSGVRMSLVGVDGKSVTTGTSGIATIKADNGTFTLRVTVPAGYESVPDRTIEIIDEDIAEVIELVSTVFLSSEAAPYCMTRFAVQDQFTETAEGTLIDVEFVRFLPGATRTAVVISPSEPLVTGAEGYVDRKLNRLAEYSAKYAVPGKVPKSLRFTTPDAGSYEVVEP